MQADAQLQRKYKGVLHCIIHSYKTEGAQVSGEFIVLKEKFGSQQEHSASQKCFLQTAIHFQSYVWRSEFYCQAEKSYSSMYAYRKQNISQYIDR